VQFHSQSTVNPFIKLMQHILFVNCDHMTVPVLAQVTLTLKYINDGRCLVGKGGGGDYMTLDAKSRLINSTIVIMFRITIALPIMITIAVTIEQS
jgi:hypothetical protein